MLVTGMLLMLANMSIEPIITVYVAQIVPDPAQVTIVAGLVMSAAALGSILSASRLGKLADRIGHWTVIIGCLLVCAALLIPQAFVTAGWQLIGLRFLMGLSLGGLLPCVATVIRHNVPERSAGSILGYSTSSQYVGQVAGPLAGGFVGGHFGMRAVFLGTSVLMAVGALYGWVSRPRVRAPRSPPDWCCRSSRRTAPRGRSSARWRSPGSRSPSVPGVYQAPSLIETTPGAIRSVTCAGRTVAPMSLKMRTRWPSAMPRAAASSGCIQTVSGSTRARCGWLPWILCVRARDFGVHRLSGKRRVSSSGAIQVGIGGMTPRP